MTQKEFAKVPHSKRGDSEDLGFGSWLCIVSKATVSHWLNEDTLTSRGARAIP